MSKVLTLIFFVAIALGTGIVIGTFSMPGEWYAGLVKPWFNPPNWLFGPVWTILYVMIGIAGARVWALDRGGSLVKLWFVQMALNFAWPPAFFIAEQPALGLVVIVLMLLSIVAFITLAWRRDRPSALLFVPYAAWVSFATLLNAALWWLNRG